MRGRADTMPRLPFTGASDATRATSRDAATTKRTTAATDRTRALAFIQAQPDGATDDEIQTGLQMAGDTERPRRIELAKAKLIETCEEMTRGSFQVRKRATRSGALAVIWFFRDWRT